MLRCRISCGGYNSKTAAGQLPERVLASQGSTSVGSFGGLILIDGYDDTFSRGNGVGAGSSPGLMAISPTRNVLAAFDISSNSVYGINTVNATAMGYVRLPGLISSMVIPGNLGPASVTPRFLQPRSQYALSGAIEELNLSSGGFVASIAVPNAQTVVSNSVTA